MVLYYLRYLDDNRLTSWQDAFRFVRLYTGLLWLIPAILAASLLARTSVTDRYPVTFLLVASFTASLPLWREPEVIVDASRYFTAAKHLELYGAGYFLREWGRNIPAWTDMPVVPFLYGIIFRWFGENRIFIQMFTAAMFSGSVLLTYASGRALWDEKVGTAGGILLLGIPYLYSQIPLMLVDVPSMFFLALSFFLFIRALERGGIMIFLSSVSVFLTFFVKYSTWLMLSVLAVIYIVYLFAPFGDFPTERKEEIVRRRRTAFIRGCMVVLVSVLLIGSFFLYKKDVFIDQINLLLAYQRPGLRRWGESFVSTFFFQIHPFITLSALFSVYAAFRKRDMKYLPVVWLLLAVFLLQIRRIRYIIMVFPMLSLAASYGLTTIRRWETVKFISCAIAAFSIVVAIFVYRPFLDRISLINLKDAGAFLDSTGAGTVEVFTVMPPYPVANIAVSVPILDFFTQRPILYRHDSTIPADAGDISISPLRFTWAYRNPKYYSTPNAGGVATALAVVSGEKDPVLCPEVAARALKMRKKTFDISTGVYDFKTFVTAYY